MKKLSSKFAKTVRDFIASEKTAGTTVYNDIFPQTRIKYVRLLLMLGLTGE